MRTLVVPAALVGLALTVALFASPLGAVPAEEECLSGPKYAAPQGGHWYYRIDRATRRHCWYVGAAGGKVRAAGGAKTSADRAGTASAADADQPARATFADVIASDDAPPAGTSVRWLDQTSTKAANPQPLTMSGSPADTDNAPAAEQPPVTADPVPAVQAASAPEPQSRGSGIGAMLAIIAGAALAAAISVGVVARLRPARPSERPRIRAAFDDRGFDRRVLSAVAEAMATPSPPITAPLPAEHSAPPRPRNDKLDVERTLERLLQDWQRCAA